MKFAAVSPPDAVSAPETVQLLWTAGWDSTYRLLDLVVRQQRPVQPHYLVDPERAGALSELRAMRLIRRQVAEDYPGSNELILPTRLTLLDALAPDRYVTDSLARLRIRGHLGLQYDGLARYRRQFAVRGLELCIHADDRAEAFVRSEIEQVFTPDGSGYWRVPADASDTDLGLFAGFRFPLLDLTKTEMRRRARAAGFERIMNLTWFCHTPRRGQPCGTCNPCRYAIAEGMADRLPVRALLRHRVYPALRMARRAWAPGRRLAVNLARRWLTICR